MYDYKSQYYQMKVNLIAKINKYNCSGGIFKQIKYKVHVKDSFLLICSRISCKMQVTIIPNEGHITGDDYEITVFWCFN